MNPAVSQLIVMKRSQSTDFMKNALSLDNFKAFAAKQKALCKTPSKQILFISDSKLIEIFKSDLDFKLKTYWKEIGMVAIYQGMPIFLVEQKALSAKSTKILATLANYDAQETIDIVSLYTRD